MSHSRLLALVARWFLLLGIACATHTNLVAAPFSYVWSAEKIAALSGSHVRLNDKNQNLIDTLPIATVRALIDIKQRISREAGIDAELVVVDGASPNAFATRVNDRNVIGFNIAMLKAFGSDAHALAAVMGHEVGHLIKGHSAAQQEHDTVIGIIGLLAGLAMDRSLQRRYGSSGNLGISIASLGTTLASRSFSRDHEREADDVGLRLMRAAGFDPHGAVRLWESMPNRGFSFLATHPPSDERVANMRTIIATLAPWRPRPTVASVTVAKAVEQTQTRISHVEYKEDSSPQDDPFILALNAYRAGRHSEAWEHTNKSAEAGDPRGQVGVGFFYLSGLGGVSRDYKKAAHYFALAEKQDSALAMTALGIMHEQGLGFSRNPAMAVTYYERAATADFPDGMARLAMAKLGGSGTPTDHVGAIALASKAAAENSSLGNYVLGVIHYRGSGVPQDYGKAREFFEKGSERGHAPSNAMLGGIFMSGQGVAPNPELAAIYFKRAADRDNADGKAGLGFLYLSGRGVSRDLAAAHRLFSESFRQGSSAGALGLGHMYREGLQVQKDQVEALAYYNVAMFRGSALARKAWSDLAAKVSETDVSTAQSRARALRSPP